MDYTEHIRVLGEPGRVLEVSEPVGLDNLPNQLVQSELQRGFEFNVMVLGETGIGKTTIISNLLELDLPETEVRTHFDECVTVERSTHELEEGGVRLTLRLSSSVGIGDQLDREKAAAAVIDHVDAQFAATLEDELKATSGSVRNDLRIHVCIYMLAATTRQLRPYDLALLQGLHKRVNLLPVIAKVDTLTPEELVACKLNVARQLEEAGVICFRPSDQAAAEVYSFKFPFGTVASTEYVTLKSGGRSRAREYPWGIVEAEDPAHSDLAALRDFVFRDHTYELICTTASMAYERYRKNRLLGLGFVDVDAEGNAVRMLDSYARKEKDNESELERREAEIRQGFVRRIADKEAEIQAAERELRIKFSRLKAIHLDEKASIERQIKEVIEQREALESTL